jgi:hypothetical protein
MRSNGRVRAQTKGVFQTIILGPKPTLSDSWRRKALRFSALRLLMVLPSGQGVKAVDALIVFRGT